MKYIPMEVDKKIEAKIFISSYIPYKFVSSLPLTPQKLIV